MLHNRAKLERIKSFRSSKIYRFTCVKFLTENSKFTCCEELELIKIIHKLKYKFIKILNHCDN